ncbi:type II secretion system protein GspD [Undibacterium macrobrachii]|uniref:Bacteriophage-related lipoprotein n=1 Tax=Undibacterium macrobrachii TaxID=1119058 RepID=A0ABQ2XFC9_9BURK|nr:type II secretory pathway protein [Undibacterium macrobrachii]GGX14036.1 bacteriophage-related lipoprotein [Undibacterium macrobrachii]
MRLIFLIILILLQVSAFASTNAITEKSQKQRGVKTSFVPTKDSQDVKFDFQSVSVAQVISLVYLEALKQPYVIDPSVLKDDRLVSFRFDTGSGNLKLFWREFLDSLGFQIETRNGVDYLFSKKVPEEIKPVTEVFVYRPQYRQVSYLTGLLTPLFTSGTFTVNRSVHATGGAKNPPNSAAPGSAASFIDQDSDTLVFQGTSEEVSKLKKIMPLVDVAIGEVVVKLVVYEVTTGKTEGSAFGLALNLLGGRFGLSIGNVNSLANSISLKSANIDAALSALSGDTRFNAISTPQLRVKSGTQARLTVGQDVPTLGAVTYSQNGGQPVQSVEYRSSGVILDLLPVVRESSVDMTIDQQISDFAKTQTGVNNSPTLTKRQLSTTVSVADGELVLIGGLTQDKSTDTHSGMSFLPKLFHTKSNDDSRTEIILMIQVTKVQQAL